LGYWFEHCAMMGSTSSMAARIAARVAGSETSENAGQDR